MKFGQFVVYLPSPRAKFARYMEEAGILPVEDGKGKGKKGKEAL